MKAIVYQWFLNIQEVQVGYKRPDDTDPQQADIVSSLFHQRSVKVMNTLAKETQ